jgi:hypothetical protein
MCPACIGSATLLLVSGAGAGTVGGGFAVRRRIRRLLGGEPKRSAHLLMHILRHSLPALLARLLPTP